MPNPHPKSLAKCANKSQLPLPSDDPFLEECVGIQKMVTLLFAAYTAHAVDRSLQWAELMKKPLRSIEWSTERLRALSGIPKPRERKRS